MELFPVVGGERHFLLEFSMFDKGQLCSTSAVTHYFMEAMSKMLLKTDTLFELFSDLTVQYLFNNGKYNNSVT